MAELTESQKWMVSLYSALLFLLIASPFTFRLVNSLTEKVGFTIADYRGCPNMYGLVLHAIVFAVLIRVMMAIPLPGAK